MSVLDTEHYRQANQMSRAAQRAFLVDGVGLNGDLISYIDRQYSRRGLTIWVAVARFHKGKDLQAWRDIHNRCWAKDPIR